MRREQYLGMTEYLNSDVDEVSMDETDLSGFMSTSSAGFGDTPPKVVTRARPSSVPSPIPQELGVSLLSNEDGIWSPISPWYAHSDSLAHPLLSQIPKMLGGVGMIYYFSQLAITKKTTGMTDPNHKKGFAVSTGLYLHPMLGWNHGLLQTAGGNRLDDPNAWWWSVAKIAVLSTGAYAFFYVPLKGN